MQFQKCIVYLLDKTQTMEKQQLELLQGLVGKKATFFKTNDAGFPQSIKCTVERIEVRDYAQYTNAVFIVFKPKGKRKLKQIIYKPYQDLLVYADHVDLNVEMFVSTKTMAGVTIRESLMCFDKRYYDLAMNSTTQEPLTFIRAKY